MKKSHDVTSFIARFPAKTQSKLNQCRSIIETHAPEAEEGMSYGMPAYKLNGKPLVYFSAFTSHIGFYATPSGHKEFAKRLAPYTQGKGSVQFPLSAPLPIDLIRDMVVFRVQENTKK